MDNKKIQQTMDNLSQLLNYQTPDSNATNKTVSEEVILDKEDRLPGGTNILIYGVPGSGKSWTIEHEYCDKNTNVERIVFYPDYSYSDFIGQILPDVDEGEVTYRFFPGPFTSILKNAYLNPSQKYILIIEEINRGNAPAIFGEAFQLLDRLQSSQKEGNIVFPEGTSEYGITNKSMAEVIYGNGNHKVRIPSNLTIIGTMNTSDQNVFTLDTAFQRRWDMRLIENSFDNVQPLLANAPILDTEVSWKTFCTTINNIIIANKAQMASAEDKRLGVFFIQKKEIDFNVAYIYTNKDLRSELNSLLELEQNEQISPDQINRLTEIREGLKHIRKFPEKVIKYLWDDAFKFNQESLFDTDNMDSLEKVIQTFVYSKGRDRFNIFKPTVRAIFYPDTQE